MHFGAIVNKQQVHGGRLSERSGTAVFNDMQWVQESVGKPPSLSCDWWEGGKFPGNRDL